MTDEVVIDDVQEVAEMARGAIERETGIRQSMVLMDDGYHIWPEGDSR